MADIAKAYVQIIPSAQGIKGSITNLLGGEASSAGTTSGASFGNALISKISSVVAAAGIGKLLYNTISEGADLEQSMGGVEALFGDEIGKQIEARAQEAYKTMQVSANTYMEQTTSFAAALLSATGNNAEEAASVADTAIQDMADNSARMGTSLDSIQNAYQGFAKQNYTMLDNLKLGYGGTKTEMERLLADAQELSGVEYNIDNLADVYQAIHVIQDDLNVTGTASKEASSTLSGSFASMKAAAENFIGNLTLGQDVSSSLETLVDTSVNFVVNNLIPAVVNVVTQLPIAIYNYLNNNLDSITQSGVTLIQGLSSGVVSGIPSLVGQVLPMITQFTANLRANASLIIQAGLDLLGNLVKGIVSALPTLIEQIPQIIINICGIINDNMPMVLQKGMEILGTILQGIWQAIPTLIENIPLIFQSVLAVWQSMSWIQLGQNLINFIVSGIQSLVTNIPTTLASIGESAWNAFTSIQWVDLGRAVIDGIIAGLSAGISRVIEKAEEVARSALNAAKNFLGINSPSKKFTWIGEMSDAGFAGGLKNGQKNIEKAMNEVTSSILNPVDTNLMMESGAYKSNQLADLDTNSNSGYNQIVNVYSPTQLSASEVARQTRNATRQMALSMMKG